MGEMQPISRRNQAIDAFCIASSGTAISAMGAIAENGVLAANRLNMDAAIWAGGATLVGAGLAVAGGAKLIVLIRSSQDGRK